MDMLLVLNETLRFLAGKGVEAFISRIFENATIGAIDKIYNWMSEKAKAAAALEGLWAGTVTQSIGSKKGKYKLILRLKRKRNSDLLLGRGLLWSTKYKDPPLSKETDVLDFTAIKTGDFLRLDFRNANESKVQFGTIIGKLLSGHKDKFKGHFAAISIIDQEPVSGTLQLNNMNNKTQLPDYLSLPE
jgi:hypothetical protein